MGKEGALGYLSLLQDGTWLSEGISAAFNISPGVLSASVFTMNSRTSCNLGLNNVYEVWGMQKSIVLLTCTLQMSGSV